MGRPPPAAPAHAAAPLGPLLLAVLPLALLLTCPQAAGAGATFQTIGDFRPAGVEQIGAISPGEHTTATAISGDGGTIIGSDYSAEIVRWTAATGLQSFPPGVSQGSRGYPGGVNYDGAVITAAGHLSAYRWTA